MVNLFNPSKIRVVEHLGFHFRMKSEIAGLLLSHWFLIALLVLIGPVVLMGWVADFVSQGITRRRPVGVIDEKSNGG